jgi:hypothetical protein
MIQKIEDYIEGKLLGKNVFENGEKYVIERIENDEGFRIIGLGIKSHEEKDFPLGKFADYLTKLLCKKVVYDSVREVFTQVCGVLARGEVLRTVDEKDSKIRNYKEKDLADLVVY